MSVIKNLVGGWYSAWLIGLGSMILMVLVSFVVSLFTDDALILEIAYFMFNGSMLIFIAITMVPVAIFLLIAIPVWNGINDFIAPSLGAFLDPWLGGLSNILGVKYYAIATVGVQDQDIVKVMFAYAETIKIFLEFVFDSILRY